MQAAISRTQNNSEKNMIRILVSLLMLSQANNTNFRLLAFPRLVSQFFGEPRLLVERVRRPLLKNTYILVAIMRPLLG